MEPVAAFQLAYQGYPWKPAKGYEILRFFWLGWNFKSGLGGTTSCSGAKKTGVIKLPNFGGINQYKSMTFFWDFPYNHALFGLVI